MSIQSIALGFLCHLSLVWREMGSRHQGTKGSATWGDLVSLWTTWGLPIPSFSSERLQLALAPWGFHGSCFVWFFPDHSPFTLFSASPPVPRDEVTECRSSGHPRRGHLLSPFCLQTCPLVRSLEIAILPHDSFSYHANVEPQSDFQDSGKADLFLSPWKARCPCP